MGVTLDVYKYKDNLDVLSQLIVDNLNNDLSVALDFKSMTDLNNVFIQRLDNIFSKNYIDLTQISMVNLSDIDFELLNNFYNYENMEEFEVEELHDIILTKSW